MVPGAARLRPMDVDVAVVGRGLIGAAAARHLAESSTSVALIGPAEPAERRSWTGPFSSHADVGRITRIAGRDEVWTEVAARSVRRYADIEARSGIDFHVPCGLLAVFADAADWVARGRARGSGIRLVEAEWVRAHTGIEIPGDAPAAHEGPPAGRIHPRRLVAAQTALTAQAGGAVIEEVVTRVARQGSRWSVGGHWGEVRAAAVLLATGGFGAALATRDLLVDRRPRTIVMAEMADPGNIPSLLNDRPADDRVHEIYWVPPARYPDGRLMIKIGGNLVDSDELGPDELTEWFHSDGSDLEVEVLENNLRAHLPGAEFLSFDRAPCVITGTPTGHPYIGWIDDGLAVALAGNGSAAKSSDELGRLAATLFAEPGWDDTIDPAVFQPRFSSV